MNYTDFHKSLIEEGSGVPVIIIDVQPSYDKWCSKVAYKLMPFLNKRQGKILAFFNGPDLGMEDSDEVMNYFIEHGLDEELASRVDFRAKTYAFFRPWMDSGMDRKNLIKAIRYMVLKRVNDSRDIDSSEWPAVFGDEYNDVEHIVNGNDSIFMPDVSLQELKQYSGCYLCGGGKDECLSEFRLILEALNIKYKLVGDFIY